MREMKDSGIEWMGKIPHEWSRTKLLNLLRCPICDGPHETPTLVDIGIPFISIDSLNDSENVDLSVCKKYISFEDYLRYKQKAKIEVGDILFTKAATIGKTAIVGMETFMVWSPIAIIKVNQVLVNNKYIYHVLNCSHLIKCISLLGSINTQINVGMRELEKAVIPLPPLCEQERIALFLDRECSEINALISRTRDSIAEYKKLKQAVISQTVTKGIRGDRTLVSSGLTWVPELPENWQIIPSKFLFRNSDLRKQPGDEQLTASQKYGIISQREYMERENSKIVLANKGIDDWKHVEPYDFVISLRSFQGGLEMSETTGCITWHYIVLKPCKPIVSKYYKWLFKSEIYIKALQRTCNFIRDGQDLRYSNFVQVPLFEPPLAEQQEIADYLDRKCAEIDRLIAQKEQFLTEIENYKKTLIYEYVTGKKEVPVEQTAPAVTFLDARALLVCRIVELMKPKGRIHLQKAMHMVDCLLGLNNETQYSRHKHGPYDVRIQEYEQAAEKKGWIKVKQGNSVEYYAGAKLEEYRAAYLSVYGDVDAEIQKICAFLAPMKTSQSERVATLLAAWNDFLLDGVNPTDQQLIQEVRTNWTPNKANSPEATWLDTLNKIRKNGFVPAGKGLRTITAG